ncbi:MAG: hypothetical protein M1828_003289 [Chrysothrix sp. TS-e1954]|nr:MAG: hypothetical protein M1828_003289 [Chrysothrix sp. TS-e1954]
MSQSVIEPLKEAAERVEQPLTVLWDKVASWQQDNIYIKSGYRPASGSYSESWKSLTYWHNETVNIYSHLIPAIMFAIGSGLAWGLGPLEPGLSNRQDLYVFACFALGAVTCLGMSATYHTICNHSQEVASFGNKLDYLGIVILIWGSFIPSIFYGFACEPAMIRRYWTMISTIGAGCAVVSTASRFRTPTWRPFRASMFAAMGLSAVVPVVHGLYLYGFKQMVSLIGLPWLVLQGLLYLTGASLYAANARISQIASHLNYPRGLLAGQIAIVTGSGQGIGAETARLFANEGARVVISDIDAKKAEEVATQIQSTHGADSAIAIPGDMLNDSYIESLAKRAADFGNGKLHIIVNNAGFTWDGVVHKTSNKQFDTIMALHVGAPFKLIRAAAPWFRVKDGENRCIVNISSTSYVHLSPFPLPPHPSLFDSRKAQPTPTNPPPQKSGINGNAGQSNYSAAKSGVTGLTKSIAKEWGPQFGVRVNTVAFGHIETRLTAAKELGSYVDLGNGERVALGIPGKQVEGRREGGFRDIPLGRPGTATEAAGAVLAVASPLMSYVDGQTIMVTGGRNM